MATIQGAKVVFYAFRHSLFFQRCILVSISIKRIECKAIIACMFVFWFLGVGFASKASASCGDYLQHSPSKTVGRLDSIGDSKSDDSSLPSSSCKNGRCRSAPLSTPIQPTRVVVVRQQPSHFSLFHFANVCFLAGRIATETESKPIEPSLDLLDPPPRAAF